MIFSVVNANASHIEPIAARIRQQDLDEIWATSAMLARPALELSLEGSEIARTWLIDGTPEAMGGISRIGNDGIVWLLGTEAIELHARQFLKDWRREFDEVQDRFERFYNYISVRNTKALRWARWLNFDVQEPAPYGIMGKPFHYFTCGGRA